MDPLYAVFVDPFVQMAALPDFFLQVLWEGLVSGILYALIALGFVLIFKASGVFNFAQGIMVVFAALSLVGLHAAGVPAFVALGLCVLIMLALAFAIERVVLRPLVNQPDLILFMATIGLTYFLIGFGELVFGGEPKVMITQQLLLPTGSYEWEVLGGRVIFQQIDIAAALIAAAMVVGLGLFFQYTRVGRALRAVADDHQAALSVGISLEQIWVVVWFAAGIVALAAGIMWGARSDVSFALQIVALKALPVLVLGGLTSVPGAIVGGSPSASARSWARSTGGRCWAAGSRAGSPTSSPWPSCWSGRRACSASASSSGCSPCSTARPASTRPATPPTRRCSRSRWTGSGWRRSR